MRQYEVDDIEKILTNPFYAITIDPIFCEPHEPIVDKKIWIKSAMNYIKQHGSKEFLTLMLNNLEGNYLKKEDMDN